MVVRFHFMYKKELLIVSMQVSGNSSVGRAPDCRGFAAIRRSMVRLRVAGLFLLELNLMAE